MFSREVDHQLPEKLQCHHYMYVSSRFDTLWMSKFKEMEAMHNVPSTAASSYCRRGASHQHVETLTRAALRTANPAASHSSQQASGHPVSDAALLITSTGNNMNCPQMAGRSGNNL